MQPLRHRLYDTDIRLMQGKVINIRRCQSCRLNGFLQGCGHRRHRKLINLLSVHMNITRRLIRLNQRIIICPSRTGKHITLRAVRTLIKRKHTAVLVSAHYRRARAVAKEHAGASVFPIHNLGKCLRPQNQSRPIKPCLYIGVRNI